MKMNKGKTTLSIFTLLLLSSNLSSLVVANKDESPPGRNDSFPTRDWSIGEITESRVRRRTLKHKKRSKKGGLSKKSKKKGSDDDEDVCDPNKCYLVESREDIEDKCPEGDPIAECEPMDDEDEGWSSKKSSKKSGKKGDMFPEKGFACACEPPTLPPEEENNGITCISVIDEADNFSFNGFETLWTEFRTRYPERPFCLLQPQGGLYDRDDLYIPDAFDTDGNTIYAVVERDDGDTASVSDWFSICNLEGLRSEGFTNVAYFIDNSGSMTTATVQASLDLLISNLSGEGITLVDGIENSAEDWVSPFLTDFII